MNVRLARDILRAYRPGGGDDQERDVRAAVKFAAQHPALDAEFRNQHAFDVALSARLDEAPLPGDLAVSLEERARRIEARRGRRFALRDPAMIAVGLAFLFLIGLLTWIFLGQMGSFAGMQETAEMVTTGDAASPGQFTEIDTKAGALADWFVMQDFEGFAVPPGLASAPVVGVRQFNFEDVPVAVAAVARPRAFFYVFEAQPLGLSLPENRWRFAAYGAGRKRAFAARQIGNMAFLVVLRDGGEAELKKYLAAHETPH
ncbi:MAG: hypothetical protein PHC88_12225 [Terrimicrobiaceae bacterium]|nr:hypothetical protein [Terrimicrobiaceae bacterium]